MNLQQISAELKREHWYAQGQAYGARPEIATYDRSDAAKVRKAIWLLRSDRPDLEIDRGAGAAFARGVKDKVAQYRELGVTNRQDESQ